MPLYEYKCEKCGEVFDELRKAEDRTTPVPCPKCGGKGKIQVSGFAHSTGGSGPSGGACIPGST